MEKGKHMGSFGGARNASVKRTYPIPETLTKWFLEHVGLGVGAAQGDHDVLSPLLPISDVVGESRRVLGWPAWRAHRVAERREALLGRTGHVLVVAENPPTLPERTPPRFEFAAERRRREAKEK